MSGIMMPYLSALGQMGNAIAAIPNLTLWYNASASTTTVNNVTQDNFDTAVVNGTRVGQWKDLSGLGHAANVNGGVSRKPAYAIQIQNSLGAVSYTSSNNENFDINPISWLSPAPSGISGLTVYVMARPTVLPVTAFPLVVTDTSIGLWWNGTNWSAGVTAGNRGTVTLTNDTTKFHIYGFVFDGSQTGNANRVKFRYERAEKTLTFTGTIPASTGTASDYFYFGGNNRSGVAGGALSNTFMDGYIGEVLIWTRTLSSSEIVTVESYLNSKWGLAL